MSGASGFSGSVADTNYSRRVHDAKISVDEWDTKMLDANLAVLVSARKWSSVRSFFNRSTVIRPIEA